LVTLAPREITIPGGAEAKVVLTVTVPPAGKEGKAPATITIRPTGIADDGTEEVLDPINVGINLEVLKI
jgi:hypothetical protein